MALRVCHGQEIACGGRWTGRVLPQFMPCCIHHTHTPRQIACLRCTRETPIKGEKVASLRCICSHNWGGGGHAVMGTVGQQIRAGAVLLCTAAPARQRFCSHDSERCTKCTGCAAHLASGALILVRTLKSCTAGHQSLRLLDVVVGGNRSCGEVYIQPLQAQEVHKKC
jgi:hypothetical protein